MPEYTFFLTFANQLSSPSHIACFANLAQDSLGWLDLPGEIEENVNGITGASGACLISPNMLACCIQGARPSVILLRLPERKTIQVLRLKNTVDPHSIVFSRDRLYLVSTGTNQIIQLLFDGSKLTDEEFFWQYPEVSNTYNSVHLNGLTSFKGTFIASCFGEKPDVDRQRNGRIFFTDTGKSITENLNQPHSPVFIDNKLFVAESGRGRILIYDYMGERQFNLRAEVVTGGYPRGLAYDGDSLFVSISSTRNISRSQQKMLGNQEVNNITSILQVNMQNLSCHLLYDFQPFAREIYDIIFLEKISPLPHKFASLSSRVLEMEIIAERFFQNSRIAHDELTRLRNEVQSSISWRITTPLRWIADKIGYKKKDGV